MSEVKSRRDAIKISLGVVVGLPLVSALNACTQCSKPAADGTSAPAAAPAADAPAAAPADASAQSGSTPAPADAAGGETLTLVSETDPLASGLNYKHDKANVPANLQQEKTGVAFAQQNCANCMFYKTAGQLDGSEVGSCQVIASGKVKAGGWCSSWAKKA
ncbi:MAG: high-potential iron-sulfur protein [Silvanigrellaceae bacterium]